MSRAWKFDKTTRLWNPVEMPDEEFRNWYVDRGVQIEKDKYYYGSGSLYPHDDRHDSPHHNDSLNAQYFPEDKK